MLLIYCPGIRHTIQTNARRPTAGKRDSNAAVKESIATSPSGILLPSNKGINSRAEKEKVIPINMAIFVSLRGQLRKDKPRTAIAIGNNAKMR